jgi:16S rRNA (guanine(527)-N(7))-methyltransferase RsmG
LTVFRELLKQCSPVTDDQAAALEAHYALLCRWNKVLNLTRIEKLEDAVERHYCESLFLAKHLKPGRIVDIGSGAGFPGFVVAAVRPDCAVTLVESHQRKAVFLREAARNMANVHVVAKRAEAVHEAFDCLISRAVSYDDLSSSVGRLADRVALLTGSEEPPLDWSVAWSVEQLPWGNNRMLRLGTFVSRETAA